MSNDLGKRIDRWTYELLNIYIPGGDDGGGGF